MVTHEYVGQLVERLKVNVFIDLATCEIGVLWTRRKA